MARFKGADAERLNDPDSWDEDDVIYLRDRGMLPEDYDAPRVAAPSARSLEETPNTGDVGTVPDDTPSPEDEDAASFIDDDLDDLSKAELVDEAKSRGIDSSGTKADLLERIRSFDADEEVDV